MLKPPFSLVYIKKDYFLWRQTNTKVTLTGISSLDFSRKFLMCSKCFSTIMFITHEIKALKDISDKHQFEYISEKI